MWKLRLAWRWLKRLRITTELGQLRQQNMGLKLQKDRAERDMREAQRLLVLLSEPLKDWDLADFPDPGYLRRSAEKANPSSPAPVLTKDDLSHLANVLDAYRLTASAVAPLRMGRVVDDKLRRRGWDDTPLGRAANSARLDPRRLP